MLKWGLEASKAMVSGNMIGFCPESLNGELGQRVAHFGIDCGAGDAALGHLCAFVASISYGHHRCRHNHGTMAVHQRIEFQSKGPLWGGPFVML